MSSFLGVDTSNYTTSLSLVEFDESTFSFKAVKNLKKLLPVKKGEVGLRQSDALFHHTNQLRELVPDMFDENFPEISAVGVSTKPRLIQGSYMPCFLAGHTFAAAVSAALKLPMFETSHQTGHILAALYSCGQLSLLNQDKPFLAFHLSGGTTDLLLCNPNKQDIAKIEQVGGSTDLKAGQLVDRIGVKMGLAFPAGTELEKLAVQSSKEYKPKICVKNLECCLSGGQNMCEKMLSGNPCENSEAAKFLFCFISDTIYRLSLNARAEYGSLPIIFAGGVMSNSIIKQKLDRLENVYFAEPRFSSDNAVGTAIFSAMKYRRN